MGVVLNKENLLLRMFSTLKVLNLAKLVKNTAITLRFWVTHCIWKVLICIEVYCSGSQGLGS